MKFAAVLPAVLLLCGCGALPFGAGSSTPSRPVPEGLQLTAQPSPAAAGATTTLSLYNGAAEPIGYNLCFAALERLRGGLWVPALSATKGCPETFDTLEPGQQASAEAPLPVPLEPGDYRFVTKVDVPLGSVPPEQLRSERFSVVEAGGG